MKYYIQFEGKWTSIFIPNGLVDMYGDIEGDIYNIRRKYSHKRIRLCWKNIMKYKVNQFTGYSMFPQTLKKEWKGPYEVFWK